MPQSVNPDEWQQDIDTAERRIGDRRGAERRRRDRVGRYVERGALLAMVVIMVVGWRGYDNQQASLRHQQRQINAALAVQRSGRAVAIDALCAAESGVVDAGRRTILGGALPDTPFVRRLERMGYPSYAVRLRQVERAARAYGASIAMAVEKATNKHGLTQKDGTLDCSRLKRAARVAR